MVMGNGAYMNLSWSKRAMQTPVGLCFGDAHVYIDAGGLFRVEVEVEVRLCLVYRNMPFLSITHNERCMYVKTNGKG